MKIVNRRISGSLLLSLSIGLLIAAAISMIYSYTPDRAHIQYQQYLGLSMADDQERLALRTHDPKYILPPPPKLIFPYKWLTLPLTIAGIMLLVAGWFLHSNE